MIVRVTHPYRITRVHACNRNYILFIKLPRPGESEDIFPVFKLSCHLPTCLPRTVEVIDYPFDRCTSSSVAVKTNFESFRFDPSGNRARVYRFSSKHCIHSTSDRLGIKSSAWMAYVNVSAAFDKRMKTIRITYKKRAKKQKNAMERRLCTLICAMFSFFAYLVK